MHTYIAAILALAALALVASAQPMPEPWKPVPGHIMTKWAADVTPDKAWPDYPRPQLVREKWLNLNGLWEYTIADVKGPSARGQILVPFPIESALSGVARPLDPAATLTYRRTFTIPKDWTGLHFLLHFGAVDWKAVVRVNGKYIGQHTGGYDPFSFDVTEAAKPGENEIIVEVNDPTDAAGQPIGKQRLKPESIWYTATSGIWQTPWLEPVSPTGVKSIHTSADPHTGIVRMTVTGLKDSPKTTWKGVVSLDGKDVGNISGTLGQESRVAISSPQSWSPDRPTLYDVRITVMGGQGDTQVFDSVQSYFAFRDIKVAKDESGINRLMLNAKPLFQFGPLDQGFWPDGLYTPPTDEAMKQDILAVKKMGGNMLRKHVKVEPDRFYYWCDKLGILVWQDMPSPFPPKDPGDWKKTYEDELQRMISALKEHPSIVMWVPFNEGWGQHDTQDIVNKVNKWDPSRLINNASGWTDMKVGNTSDLHSYPGPGMNPVDPARASVLGEFGGLGLPLEGHTWTTRANWGYVSFKDQKELTDAYVGLIDRIPALIAQGLCAAVYTQTTDVEIECNGWMTYDRAVWKIDPARAAEATKKLYGPPPKITVILPDAHTPPQPKELQALGVATSWKYTLEKPEGNWIRADFDDSKWQEGKAGFGSEGTPGAIIGTEWKSGDIWLRRKFNYAGHGRVNPYLSIHHDEDAEVYFNGELVAHLKGYSTGYTLEPLGEMVRGAMSTAELPKAEPYVEPPRIDPIEIILAVHCHQTQGGQYIDLGIVDVKPR